MTDGELLTVRDLRIPDDMRFSDPKAAILDFMTALAFSKELGDCRPLQGWLDKYEDEGSSGD